MEKQNVLTQPATGGMQTAGREEPVDVSGLRLDLRVPQELRPACLLSAMGDPYCFRVGELRVRLEFADNAPPLQDTFLAFLRRKKCGL